MDSNRRGRRSSGPGSEEEGKDKSVARWVPIFLGEDRGLSFLSAKEPEARRHRLAASLYLGLSLHRLNTSPLWGQQLRRAPLHDAFRSADACHSMVPPSCVFYFCSPRAAAAIPRRCSRSATMAVDRRSERPERGDGERPPHGLAGAAAASIRPDGRRWTRGQEAISWEPPGEEIPSREGEDEAVRRTSNRYFLFSSRWQWSVIIVNFRGNFGIYGITKP
jgi:hypothetical protein